MVKVIQADRRSAVLTPSNLVCLSHMPTINLTSGCGHGCIYCYTRGYSTHPGENTVVFYRNTLDKLQAELARKKKRPYAVYFSPSSDLFQPVLEVLELGYHVFEFLFSQRIGVAFLSKGQIPEKTMKLLLANADRVRAQIGVTTLDVNIQRMFEPNAASPWVRIEQISRLVAGGIATEARLDPVLPGLTDSEDALQQIFSTLTKVGVKRVAVSTLFLRSSVLESLRRNVQDKEILQRLLASYRDAKRMAIHAEHSSVMSLPGEIRKEIYTRIGYIAQKHDIKMSICGCKNPDITHETCNIGGNWPGHETQRNLFEYEG
ncbi:MAG: radical SAM protein [Dehalococcoidia bacterium]|jgi:DNA repair photolyase